MQHIGNLFNFQPATSGERLFKHVANQFLPKEVLKQVYQLEHLQIGNRQDDLSEYFVGIYCFNLTARLTKVAQEIVEDYGILETDRPNRLRAYLQTEFGVAIDRRNSADINKLISLSITSALNSGKKISPSVKKLVTPNKSSISCYICGYGLQHSGTDETTLVQYEHIWPSSYGGESIVENLLPACPECNKKKGDMLLWQDAHVHSFVCKPSFSDEAFKSISRPQKIALHRRKVFREACENRITLKEAAARVGAMDMNVLTQIHLNDAVDFFNCAV